MAGMRLQKSIAGYGRKILQAARGMVRAAGEKMFMEKPWWTAEESFLFENSRKKLAIF